MRVSRTLVATAVLIALPMSQIGHWLAYLLHFGSGATVRQAGGAHAYFPALLETSGVALGAVLLVALLVVGLARFMVGLRNERLPSGGWPLVPLLLTALTVQLGIFAVQEVLEASLRGLASPAAAPLLGWGLAGQLPVALLAALGLSWISGRVRRALRQLKRSRAAIALPRPVSSSTPALAPVIDDPLRTSAPAVVAKRGPPFSPRS